MEQVFFQVAPQIAALMVNPTLTYECSANCTARCTSLSGKLWRFSHGEKHEHRLYCGDACALEVMNVNSLSVA